MSTQIGIRELRDSLTAVVRRVSRGETIEVTNHGKPVAVISPVAASPFERLLASGDVAQIGQPFDPRAITPLHAIDGFSASEALEEDRSDR